LSGILYFVPTPVGNLEDMTYRAVNVLKEVDYILCEDTRTSGILLKHFEISKPLKSYHLHNEHQATEKVIADLKTVRISLLLPMQEHLVFQIPDIYWQKQVQITILK
jgi:16S rRNA C1402 (ribose-2'-O) methylase RsmI